MEACIRPPAALKLGRRLAHLQGHLLERNDEVGEQTAAVFAAHLPRSLGQVRVRWACDFLHWGVLRQARHWSGKLARPRMGCQAANNKEIFCSKKSRACPGKPPAAFHSRGRTVQHTR